MGVQPYLFMQHPAGINVPNDEWTPFPWGTTRSISDFAAWFPNFKGAGTTIAAGSNSQALPFATINVASTTGFATAGYLAIRIGTTDTIVQYVSKNDTQFLGCTLGTGTMLTGQIVTAANVEFTTPGLGTIGNIIAEAAWTSDATGVRGIRFRDMTPPFFFEAGADVKGAVATPAAAPLRTVACEQVAKLAAAASGGFTRVEVYQNKTAGALATLQAATSFGYPRLVAGELVSI